MTFTPQNKLEEVLMKATTEPAHRPEFFTELMDATVYIIGNSDDASEQGASTLPVGSQVEIQHWEKLDGSTAIPFFSSLEALQMAISTEASFLALPARSLFELTQGQTLFLNPKLPYGKEFLPQEVEHMLAGEGNGFVQSRVVEQPMEVHLSQPDPSPDQMIDSLTQLLAKHRPVRRAWVAQIQEGEAEPNLLIALELVDLNEVEAVVQAVGTVASDTVVGDQPVDICLVDKEEKDGVSHYFLHHATPFYERKWGSFLREFKQTGKA
ncbi:MAG: enhanced serine sensitivity protein SseB [Symbiopectobacterium sp.]|uniref:enhanced serine sensitivity protein SseB n=1 Tax=Symbiopectobacterium sp. TaxID=2952789 RepID=UPI0039E7D3C5